MNRRTALATVVSLGVCLSFDPASAAGIKPYSGDTFANAVDAGPVIVHVYADWCLVCAAQKPTLTNLSNDPKLANVQFIAVNFDKDKIFLKANRIANQSVIVAFKNGKEILRLSGTTDAAQIRDAVMKVL